MDFTVAVLYVSLSFSPLSQSALALAGIRIALLQMYQSPLKNVTTEKCTDPNHVVGRGFPVKRRSTGSSLVRSLYRIQ